MNSQGGRFTINFPIPSDEDIIDNIWEDILSGLVGEACPSSKKVISAPLTQICGIRYLIKPNNSTLRLETWITDREPNDSTAPEDLKAHDDISLFLRQIVCVHLKKDPVKFRISFANNE